MLEMLDQIVEIVNQHCEMARRVLIRFIANREMQLALSNIEPDEIVARGILASGRYFLQAEEVTIEAAYRIDAVPADILIDVVITYDSPRHGPILR